TGLSGTASSGVTETWTQLNVCDKNQELRVGLAWIEDSGDSLAHDLDLELQAPSGRVYYGNYFTDDNDKNGTTAAGENCDFPNEWPFTTGAPSTPDSGPWSLKTCANSVRDTKNPTEAIFLSPDPRKDGINDNPATASIDESADN